MEQVVYVAAGNKKTPIPWSFQEATGGFEPQIRELQTYALAPTPPHHTRFLSLLFLTTTLIRFHTVNAPEFYISYNLLSDCNETIVKYSLQIAYSDRKMPY